ncbi:MAG: relaxase/mobilization nuclease domain-containing protein [Prevotella sp.]
MIIKIEAIDGQHAANAISYVLDKEKARKENKPVLLAANNIELNPLTGKPYSPVEVLMDMQLLIGKYRHRVSKPFWRIELCPPPEACQDWTIGQWQKFLKECVHALDATAYNGKHTMLTQSQYVAAYHCDTAKPHVHIVSNRLTTDGKMQDTHKCMERARRCANIIAEKYGWSTADERSNQRMARIHEAAIKILRDLESWNIETYFSELRWYGFEVDPVYDKHGVCRGYSIGEKLYDLDGNYSSTVMYKASNKNFGHARDLTVSKLFSTWQAYHPQKEETHTEKVPVPDKTATTGNGVGKSDPLPVQPEADLVQPHTQTDGEKERERAIWRATRAIGQYIERSFRKGFTPHELEETLPLGIVALSIESDHSSPFSEENLKAAARELLDYVECSTELADSIMDTLYDIVLSIALPDVQPSIGGGGAESNIRNREDENWELWMRKKRKRKRGIRR